MIRAAVAGIGGLIGGAVPLAMTTAAVPVGVQIGVSVATGTIGALGALYAFAKPRKECEATHHGVNNKIQTATLKADSAAREAAGLGREISEIKGEVKGMNQTLNRIADHLGV
jgi:hypothetical protein